MCTDLFCPVNIITLICVIGGIIGAIHEIRKVKKEKKPMVVVGDDMEDIIRKVRNSHGIDLTLIPRNPMVYYFNNSGQLFHQSDRENDFYAIQLMIAANNLKGYYCKVETEWWDNDDAYQGKNGDKNYKRYCFNVDDSHSMDDKPEDLFQFPYSCISEMIKLKK